MTDFNRNGAAEQLGYFVILITTVYKFNGELAA